MNRQTKIVKGYVPADEKERYVASKQATALPDDSVVVSRVTYNMLELMVDDLMKAEAWLNDRDIETRVAPHYDEFRSMEDIVADIKASL